MSTGPERKLAAIMLADIVGFSALMERDESGTFERVRALRERLVAPRIASHAGRIIKTTGDGFLAEFPSATAALQCAIEIQRQNHAQEQDFMPDARIHMRIGINVGDVIIDGDDVAGDGVVIAARLEPLAAPDGICVSATVREHIRQELGVEYHDLGEQHVKNISRPIRAYQIDVTGAPMVAARASTGRRRSQRRILALGALAVSVGVAVFGGYRTLGHWEKSPDLRMTFAILPVTAPADDKAAGVFASSLTDAFITRQTNSPWSRVVSRESVQAAMRADLDTARLGRALNVRYLVRASVTHTGDYFATNASVVEADSGQVLGTRDFKWPVARPVNVNRDEIDGTIGWLAGRGYRKNELEEAKRKNDADRDVRDLNYLASDAWSNDRASYDKAMGYLRRAQALSPDDKLTLTLLARINLCECRAKWATDPAAVEKIGADAVETYLRRYPVNPQMQAWRTYLNELHGRHEDNLVLYERMLEQSPDDPSVLASEARTLVKLGRAKEALELVDRILREDSSAGTRVLAGDVNFRLGNDTQAADYARKAIIEMSRDDLKDPWGGGVHLLRAAAEARGGRVPQAKATLAEFQALVPEATSISAIRKWQDVRALNAGYEPFYDALRKAGLPE